MRKKTLKIKQKLVSLNSIILLLFTFVIISCAPTRKYQEHIDRFKPDIEKFKELDHTNIYPENSIMYLGSSSILLWDSIQADMAPYPVIQRGFGGACFADVAYYAEQLTAAHNLAALVVFAGNDIWGKETDRTPDEIAKLLEYTLKKVRKHHSNIPIFIIEVSHVPKREHLIKEIDAENRALKNVCDKHENVYWIATRSMFLTSNNKVRRDIFRDDNIHQTEKGYKEWTELIKNEIKKRL